MSDWYCVRDTDRGVEVEFIPSPNRFWPPAVLGQNPLHTERVNGRRVILTGPGAVWMYAHAAATFRAKGASDVCVQTPNLPGTSEDLDGSASLLIPAGDEQAKGALLVIQLRPSPPLSPSAIDRLLEPRLEELARLLPAELVLSGRASVGVYARAAHAAVDSGVRRIRCWSARDGLVAVFDPDCEQLGCQIAPPNWLAQAMPKPVWPSIIGVMGDPNVGKSVFSRALDWYREQIGCGGWMLDCDVQSPTPAWYLSLGEQESSRILRELQKRRWTPEMEEAVAKQLRSDRDLFSVLIADLPGGDHHVKPPRRVPEGRERIFAEVDALLLLDRPDAPSEAAWREGLRPHGLDVRIAAVLASCNPEGSPSLSVCKDGSLWRGEVTGLDRGRSPADLGHAFRNGFDQLWPALLEAARRRSVDG